MRTFNFILTKNSIGYTAALMGGTAFFEGPDLDSVIENVKCWITPKFKMPDPIREIIIKTTLEQSTGSWIELLSKVQVYERQNGVTLDDECRVQLQMTGHKDGLGDYTYYNTFPYKLIKSNAVKQLLKS